MNPWQAALEIWLIAIAVLYAYRLFRGTRGASILYGLIIVFAVLAIMSHLLHLQVIAVVLQAFSAFVVLALLIIFQPELRQALAQLGQGNFLAQSTRQSYVIENVVQAVNFLKEHGHGALIAFERRVEHSQVKQSGVVLDAEVSEELLCTIFTNKTPLHDGGVIIAGERVQTAGCIFPVTQRQNLSRQLGLRHRAALGLSEESDALIVVLSEERGEISLCVEGDVQRPLTIDQLRLRLTEGLMKAKRDDGSKEDESEGKKKMLLDVILESLPHDWAGARRWGIVALEVALAFVVAGILWFLIMKNFYSGAGVGF